MTNSTPLPLQGFNAVATSALRKTSPVTELVEVLRSVAQECIDFTINPTAFRLDPNTGRLHLKRDALPEQDDELWGLLSEMESDGFGFTQTGVRGLASWAGVNVNTVEKLHDAVFNGDTEAAHVLASLINWGLSVEQENRESPFLLRTRGTDVRAVFSDQYTPVDNDWLMNVLAKLIPGGRVSHYRSDGDSMSGLVLIPDAITKEVDSDYGASIAFMNDEVGRRKLTLLPGIFRFICSNGMIVGQRLGAGIETRHRQIDLNDLAHDIAAVIETQIPKAKDALAVLLATKEIRLEGAISSIALIDHLSSRYKLSKKARVEWFNGWVDEAADTTAFGLIQGLTRSVRSSENVADSSFEALAGDLAEQSEDWWLAQMEASLPVFDIEEAVATYGNVVEELIAA